MVNTASSVSSSRLLIEGKGEDSWRESGTDETPQERKQRGGSAPRPRKAKPCMEINGGVISGSAHVSHLFVFRLDSVSSDLTSFYASLHKFNIFFTVS